MVTAGTAPKPAADDDLTVRLNGDATNRPRRTSEKAGWHKARRSIDGKHTDFASVGCLRRAKGRIDRPVAIQTQNIGDLMLKGFENSIDSLARTDDEFPIRSRRNGTRAGVVPAERKAVIV